MTETKTFACDTCGAFVEWNARAELYYDNMMLRLKCPVCESIITVDTSVNEGKSWDERFDEDEGGNE